MATGVASRRRDRYAPHQDNPKRVFLAGLGRPPCREFRESAENQKAQKSLSFFQLSLFCGFIPRLPSRSELRSGCGCMSYAQVLAPNERGGAGGAGPTVPQSWAKNGLVT